MPGTGVTLPMGAGHRVVEGDAPPLVKRIGDGDVILLEVSRRDWERYRRDPAYRESIDARIREVASRREHKPDFCSTTSRWDAPEASGVKDARPASTSPLAKEGAEKSLKVQPDLAKKKPPTATTTTTTHIARATTTTTPAERFVRIGLIQNAKDGRTLPVFLATPSAWTHGERNTHLVVKAEGVAERDAVYFSQRNAASRDRTALAQEVLRLLQGGSEAIFRGYYAQLAQKGLSPPATAQEIAEREAERRRAEEARAEEQRAREEAAKEEEARRAAGERKRKKADTGALGRALPARREATASTGPAKAAEGGDAKEGYRTRGKTAAEKPIEEGQMRTARALVERMHARTLHLRRLRSGRVFENEYPRTKKALLTPDTVAASDLESGVPTFDREYARARAARSRDEEERRFWSTVTGNAYPVRVRATRDRLEDEAERTGVVEPYLERLRLPEAERLLLEMKETVRESYPERLPPVPPFVDANRGRRALEAREKRLEELRASDPEWRYADSEDDADRWLISTSAPGRFYFPSNELGYEIRHHGTRYHQVQAASDWCARVLQTAVNLAELLGGGWASASDADRDRLAERLARDAIVFCPPPFVVALEEPHREHARRFVSAMLREASALAGADFEPSLRGPRDYVDALDTDLPEDGTGEAADAYVDLWKRMSYGRDDYDAAIPPDEVGATRGDEVGAFARRLGVDLDRARDPSYVLRFGDPAVRARRVLREVAFALVACLDLIDLAGDGCARELFDALAGRAELRFDPGLSELGIPTGVQSRVLWNVYASLAPGADALNYARHRAYDAASPFDLLVRLSRQIPDDTSKKSDPGAASRRTGAAASESSGGGGKLTGTDLLWRFYDALKKKKEYRRLVEEEPGFYRHLTTYLGTVRGGLRADEVGPALEKLLRDYEAEEAVEELFEAELPVA